MLSDNEVIYYKRYLPHYQISDKPIFVTWRLAFSLPQPFLDMLSEHREKFEQKLNTSENLSTHDFNKIQFDHYDKLLSELKDAPSFLSIPEIADIVASVLQHDNHKKYTLLAYSLMPNHVHVLYQPLLKDSIQYYQMADILKSWKGVSARRINQFRHTEGQVWSIESYDHVVRDAEECNRIAQYIIDNPVKAKLVTKWNDWRSIYISEKLMSK